jgi:hypothetical protein
MFGDAGEQGGVKTATGLPVVMSRLAITPHNIETMHNIMAGRKKDASQRGRGFYPQLAFRGIMAFFQARRRLPLCTSRSSRWFPRGRPVVPSPTRKSYQPRMNRRRQTAKAAPPLMGVSSRLDICWADSWCQRSIFGHEVALDSPKIRTM